MENLGPLERRALDSMQGMPHMVHLGVSQPPKTKELLLFMGFTQDKWASANLQLKKGVTSVEKIVLPKQSANATWRLVLYDNVCCMRYLHGCHEDLKGFVD